MFNNSGFRPASRVFVWCSTKSASFVVEDQVPKINDELPGHIGGDGRRIKGRTNSWSLS